MKFSEFIRSHGFEPRDLSDDQLDNMAEWHSRLATTEGETRPTATTTFARWTPWPAMRGFGDRMALCRIPRHAQQSDS